MYDDNYVIAYDGYVRAVMSFEPIWDSLTPSERKRLDKVRRQVKEILQDIDDRITSEEDESVGRSYA